MSFISFSTSTHISQVATDRHSVAAKAPDKDTNQAFGTRTQFTEATQSPAKLTTVRVLPPSETSSIMSILRSASSSSFNSVSLFCSPAVHESAVEAGHYDDENTRNIKESIAVVTNAARSSAALPPARILPPRETMRNDAQEITRLNNLTSEERSRLGPDELNALSSDALQGYPAVNQSDLTLEATKLRLSGRFSFFSDATLTRLASIIAFFVPTVSEVRLDANVLNDLSDATLEKLNLNVLDGLANETRYGLNDRVLLVLNSFRDGLRTERLNAYLVYLDDLNSTD